MTTPTNDPMTTEALAQSARIAEATERGTERGESARQYASDGDDAPEWLSGEWAGESITELLGDLLDECDDDERDEIEQAYCDAADAAFYGE